MPMKLEDAKNHSNFIYYLIQMKLNFCSAPIKNIYNKFETPLQLMCAVYW